MLLSPIRKKEDKPRKDLVQEHTHEGFLYEEEENIINRINDELEHIFIEYH